MPYDDLEKALYPMFVACDIALQDGEISEDRYPLMEFLSKLGLLLEDKYPFKPK